MPVQERPGRIEYLYLTPEQNVEVEAMNKAIDDLPIYERLRCRTPQVREKDGKMIEYYPHMDYDERTPPSQPEANLMCRTAGKMCPLAEQCLKLGLSLEAKTGVWGGRVLLDGEVYNH